MARKLVGIENDGIKTRLVLSPMENMNMRTHHWALEV